MYCHNNNFYELRKGIKIKSSIPETKFESLTFKHFFPRLLCTFKNLDFTLRKDAFKVQINLTRKEGITALLKKFPKFDIMYSAFYRKKKKYLDKKKKRMPRGIKVI